MLRACYSARSQFYHDSSGTTEIQWYQCAADAKALPYPTAFGSCLYDQLEDVPETPLGERYSPRPWRGGATPQVGFAGGLCGDRSAWSRGVSVLAPAPGVYPNTSVPACCNKPPEFSTGGALQGYVLFPPSCPGGCLRPARVYYTVGTCFVDSCGLAGTVFALDALDGQVIYNAQTWNLMWQSPPFDFGGTNYRFTAICNGPGTGGTMVMHVDGDLSINNTGSSLFGPQCSPYRIVTGLFGNFGSPCFVFSCDGVLSE